MTKNKKHPEQRDNEVFISNVSIPKENDIGIDLLVSSFDDDERKSDFDEIRWQTKRMGSIAYDNNGNVLKNNLPVFVRRSEIEAAGLDPDKLFED